MSSSSSQQQQQQQQRKGIEPQQCITIIEANDVLLGRGNHVHNPGNAKFRMLVLSRSVEYWSCNNNVTKDGIARQIIDQISSLGGRFLRKLKKAAKGEKRPDDTAAASSERTIDESMVLTSDVWELADMETILVKVKQTFRDFTASAKKKTASSSLPVRSQQTVSLSSLIRPSSITIPESNNISNVLHQTNTGMASGLDLGRLEHSLLSSGIIHNTGPQRNTTLFQRNTDARDSLFQAARALQLEHLQDEINQNSARSHFEEMLTQQRTVASWQESLRQQHLVSEPSSYLNHNRHQPDGQMLLLLQNNTLQDQFLLRQLIMQHTSHQSQTGLPLFTNAINRPRESALFPHNEAMLLHSNIPQTRFLQTLEESNRARQQESQQLLGNLDRYTSTLYETLPRVMNTNALRQAATGAPAYETSFLSNANDMNFLNAAVANVITGQNLTSTMTTNLPQLTDVVRIKSVDSSDEDDGDKKPAGTKK